MEKPGFVFMSPSRRGLRRLFGRQERVSETNKWLLQAPSNDARAHYLAGRASVFSPALLKGLRPNMLTSRTESSNASFCQVKSVAQPVLPFRGWAGGGEESRPSFRQSL